MQARNLREVIRSNYFDWRNVLLWFALTGLFAFLMFGIVGAATYISQSYSTSNELPVGSLVTSAALPSVDLILVVVLLRLSSESTTAVALVILSA